MSGTALWFPQRRRRCRELLCGVIFEVFNEIALNWYIFKHFFKSSPGLKSLTFRDFLSINSLSFFSKPFLNKFLSFKSDNEQLSFCKNFGQPSEVKGALRTELGKQVMKVKRAELELLKRDEKNRKYLSIFEKIRGIDSMEVLKLLKRIAGGKFKSFENYDLNIRICLELRYSDLGFIEASQKLDFLFPYDIINGFENHRNVIKPGIIHDIAENLQPKFTFPEAVVAVDAAAEFLL